MSQRITRHNGTAIATDSLYYRSTDRGETSQVEMLSTKAGLYSYTYDANGNIASVPSLYD